MGTRAAMTILVVGIAAALVSSGSTSQRDAWTLAQLLSPASGGDATTQQHEQRAFATPAPHLTDSERLQFAIGDAFFTEPWQPAPAADTSRDGLGPLFNAPSCFTCHILGGRAAPVASKAGRHTGLLLRVGSRQPDGTVLPHPAIGTQLQDHAIDGVPPEGVFEIAYETIKGVFPDGAVYTLAGPTYTVVPAAGVDLGSDTALGPRAAPLVAGTGLLDAVPEDMILEFEDPSDHDGDGISGRAHRVSAIGSHHTVLGRFGWKASMPSLTAQIAGAFANDMGITSHTEPDTNCLPTQTACSAAPSGGEPEISDERLASVVAYAATLGVPERRNLDDPNVGRGARHFTGTGCGECHRPTLRTGNHAVDSLANQTIHPFTDLLLHDMGNELADGLPVADAARSEWRTPPLWGIGLVEVVNGHTRFLHDGRARSLEEAILWHGGEAAASRFAYTMLTRSERAELIAFLRSL